MREVELKSVVDNLERRRAAVEEAGARLVFEGQLIDMRYDFPHRSLSASDNVLRVRAYEHDGDLNAQLDWKGPTSLEHGFKVREEVSTTVGDLGGLGRILEGIGLELTQEIDRRIAQYDLGDAVIRFEQYPDMDTLVEIEGEPDAIEQAIRAIGLPRDSFTPERLPQFVRRFEVRTGRRAAISARELEGDYRYRPEDA